MTLRQALRLLLCFALGLPLVQATLLWASGLLRAMGDETAADVVGHLNTAVGVAWLVSVVGLVVTLALRAFDEP
jgi:hypothetical protein